MGLDDTSSLARPKCPNCGFLGVPGARFCSSCGTRLDRDAFADATGVMGEVTSDDYPSGPTAAVPQRPESGAVLVISKGPDSGARFPLEKDVVRIGRSPDSDVFLDDVTVSRNHAEILHGITGWLLRDKGSLNGTYVNFKIVDEARLAQADEVQIGKYRFTFWAAE